MTLRDRRTDSLIACRAWVLGVREEPGDEAPAGDDVG
jgi:hypothetical protein